MASHAVCIKQYRLVSRSAPQLGLKVHSNCNRNRNSTGWIISGWMFFTKEQLGERQTRLQVAVQYLQNAIESDNTSGASWYLLGRYLRGKDVDAIDYTVSRNETSLVYFRCYKITM